MTDPRAPPAAMVVGPLVGRRFLTGCVKTEELVAPGSAGTCVAECLVAEASRLTYYLVSQIWFWILNRGWHLWRLRELAGRR